MPFVQAARDFLANPPPALQAHARYMEMRATVEYMLAHAVGLQHGVSIDSIVEHLENSGFSIHREAWQTGVLGPLREHGVFIGTALGPTGMFIISNRDDAHKVRDAYARRIAVEQRRLEILEGLMRRAGWL